MESIQSVQSFNQPTQIQVDSILRWNIYHRLLDLSIPCSCETGKPLQVCIENPVDALQLWSVIRQATASRNEHIDWLNTCWEVQS